MDMISKLPPSIIENILCLVPIQEAARTSILSKEWRYHWTKIPKIEFCEYTFQVSDFVEDAYPDREERLSNIQSQRDWEGMTYSCKLFYALYQILLKHEGPIHEFTLSVIADEECVEIDHIMSYLSRNFSVKKLTLDIGRVYALPLSLFSFDQLTDLHLEDCNLCYNSTFNVFQSLTNLSMGDYVIITKKGLLSLLSSCPLLKSLTLMIDEYCSSDNLTVINLFECIPTVENLSIWTSTIEDFAVDGVPQVLPMPLIHLKYIYIDDMSFMYKYGLPLLLCLIRSSPNLEKLKLQVNEKHYFEDLLQYDECYSLIQNCSNFRLDHLNELEILDFSNEKLELDFVKFILANSPVLNKVRIYLSMYVHEDAKLKVSEILLNSQCASLAVEIIVEQKVKLIYAL